MLLLLLCSAIATTALIIAADSVFVTIAFLAVAVLCVGILEHNAAALPEVIRAHKFEVVGADGVTRIVLGETIDDVGAVAIYDASGRCVRELVAGHAGPSDAAVS